MRFTIGAETVPQPRANESWVINRAADRLPRLDRTGEGVTATIEFHWLAAGGVTLDSEGRLTFARLPERPGVYRFRFEDGRRGLLGVYIGESDNLARRMSNYRNPGPTQPTNQRLNAHLLGVLRGGGSAGAGRPPGALLPGEVNSKAPLNEATRRS